MTLKGGNVTLAETKYGARHKNFNDTDSDTTRRQLL